MTRDVKGRTIISCDRCHANLDLGPVAVRNSGPRRSPSGWLATGRNKHLCSLCSAGYTTSFIRRFG